MRPGILTLTTDFGSEGPYVAAHLLRGGSAADLGPIRDKVVSLANFEPRADVAGLVGEVIFRDAFGNLITNVPAERLVSLPPDAWTIELAGERIEGLRRTYSD